jgi:hypothetical protein
MRGFGTGIWAIIVLAAVPATAREPSRPQLRPSIAAADRKPAIPMPPMPRPRPPEAPVAPVATAAPAAPAPEPAPAAVPLGPPIPSDCFVRLTDGLAVAKLLPVIAGPGECGATDVISLEAVLLPDKRRVAVTPPATLRCSMAEAIVHWVRDDVAAALKGLGSPLSGIDNYASYECRGRNRIPGAKLSQHGLANALDIRSFVLGDGRHVTLTDHEVAEDLRKDLRASACARFTTVLGPGSDGYHESHIHVDLTERRGGYRICQWDIRTEPDIPMPRPRPPEAPQAQAQAQPQTQTPIQTQTQTQNPFVGPTKQTQNPFVAPTKKN